MLVGDPPFTGSTAQAIVAKVLAERPSGLHARRDRVPANVERAVLTALEKLPADRFASAADFSTALRSEYVELPPTSRIPQRVPAPQRVRVSALVAAVVGLAVVGLAVVAAWGWLRPRVAEPPLIQFEVVVPNITTTDAIALSPDGQRLAYPAGMGEVLYVRDLSDSVAVAVSTGDDYWTPFFSPDGKTVGHLTGFPGGIKLVSPAGGQKRTLVASDVYANGATWSDDGWIYYNAGGRAGTRLMRIRAEGGAPELVMQPDSARNERFSMFPRALPGGRRLLVTVFPIEGDASIALIDVRSKTLTPLAKGVSAFYADPGLVVVMQADGSIRAAELDAGSGSLHSSFVTIADGAFAGDEIRAPFAVSTSGTMLYELRNSPRDVARVRRDGRETPLVPGWRGYFLTHALSPDGTHLAISVSTGARTKLWTKALPDGPFVRLAPGVNLTHRPDWSPDGKTVTFISDHAGAIAPYRVPADGSRPPELLVHANASVDEAVISRDGQWVIYRQGSGTSRHLAAMRLGVDTVGRLLLPGSTAQEFSPTLSPDGRWLAYASTESGREEVYIRPFPNAQSAKYVVSRNGGREPLWSHSGRELFFRTPTSDLVAAEVATGATPTVTSLRVLFPTPSYVLDVRHRGYSVAPDDQSFIFVKDTSLNAAPRVRLATSVAQLYRAKTSR